MSVFRSDKVGGRARGVKALPLLLRERRISKKLISRRQELRRIRTELLRTADKQKIIEYKQRKKSIQQEIFGLENDLRCAAEARSNGDQNGRQAPQEASESATGAMPDFLIIGAVSAEPPSSTTSCPGTRTSNPPPKKSCTTSTSSTKRRGSIGIGGASRGPSGKTGEGSSPERPPPTWVTRVSPKGWRRCSRRRG